jgi:hypothetical protein
VPLTEDTYFTFNKRDLRSGPVDVLVAPAADITCGDGKPSPEATRVHLTGDMWTRRTMTASPTEPTPAAPDPATPGAGPGPAPTPSDSRSPEPVDDVELVEIVSATTPIPRSAGTSQPG